MFQTNVATYSEMNWTLVCESTRVTHFVIPVTETSLPEKRSYSVLIFQAMQILHIPFMFKLKASSLCFAQVVDLICAISQIVSLMRNI